MTAGSAFVVLLRGINVGGRNAVPMGRLLSALEDHGFADVATYLASGNVLLRSPGSAKEVGERMAAIIAEEFPAVDGTIAALAVSRARMRRIIRDRPDGFGDHPDRFHSDAIFMMGITLARARTAFDPRDGVDELWTGSGVIYHQRLSAVRTRTRLNKAMSSPLFDAMTMRSWGTVTELATRLDAMNGA